MHGVTLNDDVVDIGINWDKIEPEIGRASCRERV